MNYFFHGKLKLNRYTCTMKEKLIKLILFIIIILLLLTPVFMRLGWKYSQKKETDIFVLDKTVLNHGYQEHLSFYWVLNNNRFVKTNTKRRDLGKINSCKKWKKLCNILVCGCRIKQVVNKSMSEV